MSKRKDTAGWIVLTCAMVVIAWQAAGLIAEREGADFTLQADDFDSFVLKLDGWRVDKLEVAPTFMEVNLLKYRLAPKQGAVDSGRSTVDGGRWTADTKVQPTTSNQQLTTDLRNAQILVRLVHGYNMRDCMRIKGYTVEELNGGKPETGNLKPESDTEREASSSDRNPEATSSSSFRSQVSGLRFSQTWRLTSGAGDRSLWMSGMLRAGDFSETDLSTTDMAFPRIGIPDDPSWMPRGLTLKSFRHPIRNFKYFMRAKWNNSRCDLPTFLGLRKPAWASDDSLTFLVVWVGGPLKPEDEAAVSVMLADVYRQALPQLQSWGKERGVDGSR
jgi:hypothetical protein